MRPQNQSNRWATLQLTDHCPATISWQMIAQRCALEAPHTHLFRELTCTVAAPAQQEQWDRTYIFQIPTWVTSKPVKSWVNFQLTVTAPQPFNYRQMIAQRCALEAPHSYLSGAMTCAVAALAQHEQWDRTYIFSKSQRDGTSKLVKSVSHFATDRSLSRNQFMAGDCATVSFESTSFASFQRIHLYRCSTCTAQAMI